MSRRGSVAKKEVMVDSVYGDPLVYSLINKVMKCGKRTVAERIVYGALLYLVLQVRRSSKDSSAKFKMDDYFVVLEGGSSRSKSFLPEGISREEVLACLHKAIKNTSPSVELKPRRVGGATYQVPVEVNEARGAGLSLRWLLDAARGGSEKGMVACLGRALLDAHNEVGAAVNKKLTVIKMAQANAAFAHFRW